MGNIHVTPSLPFSLLGAVGDCKRDGKMGCERVIHNPMTWRLKTIKGYDTNSSNRNLRY